MTAQEAGLALMGFAALLGGYGWLLDAVDRRRWRLHTDQAIRLGNDRSAS